MAKSSTISEYDLCVIGGGINGTGIARDAAGRGLSVLLVEAKDLACATSSSSTKLIHGGLRYLEYFELGLVRESLKEREVLMSIAPHIISPLEFVLPHDENQRPSWMIRIGLFLYDHLAKRELLPGSRGVSLKSSAYGRPLKDEYSKGFSYTDCWVDDARLVVLNAVSAARKRADIRTYTRCTGIECNEGGWDIKLNDMLSGEASRARAKMVINAAGPWVLDVIKDSGLGAPTVPNIRLVKGSHIIVDRAYEGEHAYILQQPDGRIVFAIPYQRDYTLIGTTEEEFLGDVYNAEISSDELEYLCAAYNRSFKQQVTRDEVLWTYSGVRPLFDDGGSDAKAVTRGYRLYRHKELGAPMISVFGGKLTTYRVLAEEAIDRILGMVGEYRDHWSASEVLPGGDLPNGDLGRFLEEQAERYPWVPLDLLYRYVVAYGSRMDVFLKGARSFKDLGSHFGDNVYEAEILYLVKYEFAKTAEDILWRRSKLGVHISDETKEAVEELFIKNDEKQASSHE